MVGNGPLHGKMALSKPHLHLGFKNSRDKHNVGIHEFVHLIDMADGNCDGFPERLSKILRMIGDLKRTTRAPVVVAKNINAVVLSRTKSLVT